MHWTPLTPEPDATNLTGEQLRARAALGRVLAMRREVEAFERRWPEPASGDSLAGDPSKAAMARELVSATRKMSRFKPPEMVLREILCLTWALLDEDFSPAFPADTT